MPDRVSLMCRECGGKCCRYFCFQIDAPDDFSTFEDVRWFLLHEDITVHVEDGDWYISIANPCKALRADGRCGSYETRPLICRKYSMDNCDHTTGDYGYEATFTTPEELEAYAIKTLGKKAYAKAREKAYKKAARKEAKRNKKREKKRA